MDGMFKARDLDNNTLFEYASELSLGYKYLQSSATYIPDYEKGYVKGFMAYASICC